MDYTDQKMLGSSSLEVNLEAEESKFIAARTTL